MVMKFSLYFLIVSVFVLFACNDDASNVKEEQVKWTKDHSVALGKSLAQEEDIMIRLFLKQRPNWDVEHSGTGLRYWVYESKGDRKPEEGEKVDVILEVRLLDDSLCYKTDEGELNTFLVDKSNVESGVQEGVKYMGVGDKAKFIIPSHLGHGLVGDLDKIPPLQVLIVDIELVAIYKP